MREWQVHALDAARQAAEEMAARLGADGSFGPEHTDIASYYKAAAMFHGLGRARAAHLILDHVAGTFARADGSFAATSDPLLASYPAYTIGWITAAAHRMGRFEISAPAWRAMQGFFHPGLGGCCMAGPYAADRANEVEMLLTAHLGVAALYLGHADMAVRAGACLLDFVDKQPEPGTRMFLRMNDAGALVTDIPGDGAEAFTRAVDAQKTGQGWFFVGYPIAFLSLLYRATGQERFLAGAGQYLDFAAGCPALRKEHFGHKVGWGAALYAEITGDERAWELAREVFETLLASRGPSGLWLEEASPQACLDQSAEVTLWLFDSAVRGRNVPGQGKRQGA